MSEIDFGRHSEDYAEYRPGFPQSFYQRIESIVPIRGARSLDLASGPGTVGLELAALGSSVVGIVTSPEQVATAQRVSKRQGLADKCASKLPARKIPGRRRAHLTLLSPANVGIGSIVLRQ